MNKYFKIFIKLTGFIFLTIHINSCGDSSNSRVFGTSTSIKSPIETCKPGCYGIPDEWYNLGLIVDINGTPINTPDPEVKKHGECYFKVCNDSSAYTNDAKAYVEKFGGDIIYETDPIKCANLSSMSFQVNESEQDASIDFENSSCQ